MSIADLPNSLRSFLGDDPARGLVDYVEQSGRRREQTGLVRLEDRFEKRLTSEIGGLRHEMEKGFTEVYRAIADQQRDLGLRLADMQRDFGVRFGDMQRDFGIRFGDLQHDFGMRLGGMQHQITVQTRWLIAVAMFIATAFKLVSIVLE